MKNLILLLISSLLFGFTSAFAQTELKVKNKIKELQNSGVTQITWYHRYCSGKMPFLFDTVKCQPDDIHYLFWKSGKSDFIQRFDECNYYEPIVGKSAAIVELAKAKHVEMAKEKIKWPTFRKMENGKMQTQMISVDHSCHGEFIIYTNGKKIRQDVDDFDLQPTIDDSDYNKSGQLVYIKRRNLSYNKNVNTYSVKLKNLVEKEITALYPVKKLRY